MRVNTTLPSSFEALLRLRKPARVKRLPAYVPRLSAVVEHPEKEEAAAAPAAPAEPVAMLWYERDWMDEPPPPSPPVVEPIVLPPAHYLEQVLQEAVDQCATLPSQLRKFEEVVIPLLGIVTVRNLELGEMAGLFEALESAKHIEMTLYSGIVAHDDLRKLKEPGLKKTLTELKASRRRKTLEADLETIRQCRKTIQHLIKAGQQTLG